MKPKKDENIVSFYTDTLSGALRDTVRGLPDGGASAFRTRNFTLNEGSETLLCASRNPGSTLWTVEHFHRLQGPSGKVVTKTPALQNACFFDALYYCARFDAAEQGTPLPDAGAQTNVPLYNAVANTAGIPFDINGLPLPAAWGKILTPGTFTEDALVMAEKTKNLPPPIKPETPAPLDFLYPGMQKIFETPATSMTEKELLKKAKTDLRANLNKAQQKIKNAAEEKQRLEDMAKSFRTTARLAKETFNALRDATERNYDIRSIGGHIKDHAYIAIPLFGQIGALCELADYARGNGFAPPARTYSVRMKKLEAAQKSLPDGPEKDLVAAFTRAAQTTFYLEFAAAIRLLCENGKISTRNLGAGLKAVDKAAKAGGWDKEQTLSLKQDYAAGRFSKQGEFTERLRPLYRQTTERLDQKAYDVESPRPAP